MDTRDVLLSLFGVVVATTVLAQLFSKRSALPLPPGPPRTVFVGNALQVPRKQPWKAYAGWAQQYGPIVCMHVFSRAMLILSSAEDVSALLVKRAALYSDRPTMWMYAELVGRRNAVFNISSQHPRFRKYRRLLGESLNTGAVLRYGDLLEKEGRVFLQRIGSEPDQLFAIIRRNVVAVIMKIAYGRTVADNSDHLVSLAERSSVIGSAASKPGRWLVDYFPILRFVPKWFPGANFRRQAEAWKIELQQLNEVAHNWTKEQMASGNYEESFTSRQLQQNLTADEEDIVRWVGAALYGGGAETSESAIKTFLYLMSLHPHIQRRAQEEIDLVLVVEGELSRLPRLEDRERMPFVNAILKEVLRWGPVAPLGLPHCVIADDEYKGYLIPKGTIVFANIWAILHDPELYPSPEEFRPDRFIQTGNGEVQRDPRDFAFGFGYRVCPGQHLAEASIFLTMASVLATYNIGPATDSTGIEVTSKVEFSTGITSHLSPFQCRITSRSQSARALLNE